MTRLLAIAALCLALGAPGCTRPPRVQGVQAVMPSVMQLWGAWLDGVWQIDPELSQPGAGEARQVGLRDGDMWMMRFDPRGAVAQLLRPVGQHERTEVGRWRIREGSGNEARLQLTIEGEEQSRHAVMINEQTLQLLDDDGGFLVLRRLDLEAERQRTQMPDDAPLGARMIAGRWLADARALRDAGVSTTHGTEDYPAHLELVFEPDGTARMIGNLPGDRIDEVGTWQFVEMHGRVVRVRLLMRGSPERTEEFAFESAETCLLLGGPAPLRFERRGTY